MRFLFIIPIFFSFIVLSQDNNKSVFTLKPALGINGCQIHGDNYSGYDKLGFFAGIAVNAHLKGKTSLDIGFYFSQKGARHNPKPAKNDFSYYRLNLNYIDLPLLLKFNVNPVYFITVGPSIAYLINYNENIDYVDFTGVYKFNRFETGVNIGLGRKILKDKFFIEVRSSNSITSIREYGQLANLVFYPNPVARFFNKGFYNNILTLLLSYNIDFKKKSETQQP
ncbi:MAG: porin family protein [Bacteroidota bacterium]|nr:porin family protein [Bacteroidota bacterium]MDP3146094.1 porin family protein [Bacteroidota bacterium]MDP3558630.1 porin family protein [Bacteroidota bacterium]